MCDVEVTRAMNPSMLSVVPFDIGDLECQPLTKLFRETTSHIHDIRIGMVATRRTGLGQEEHPAVALGLTVQRPTIQFVDTLDRNQRIDVIAHELVHILLVYQYGLRMIDRRFPYQGSGQDPFFDYLLGLNNYWKYFLEQTVNTIHHGILIDYLHEEYGIPSDFFLALFRHNFRVASESHYADRESQYAKGLLAFEYAKRIGTVGNGIHPYPPSESVWKAYWSAEKHFGGYGFHAIPTPATYEENVLSFLEDLGYQRRDFVFLPLSASGSPSSVDSISPYALE